MTRLPVRLPDSQNRRLQVVNEHRLDRIAYLEVAEREAGSPEHLPTEWRDWTAAHPGPTLKARWVDGAWRPAGPDDERPDMRNPTHHFRISDSVWRRFARVTRRRGDSMSEVLRRAVVAYLLEHETDEDRA